MNRPRNAGGPSWPLSSEQRRSLQKAVLELHRWFKTHARDLPWRRTRDPYAIWVSEVMLQQTQVKTVIPYFQRWMSTFPTVEDLASAHEDQVLGLWEGLGYYSRALNLWRAAQDIVHLHQGQIPSSPEVLGLLPGIGSYTMAAILSIAFDQDLATVDGNVRRVLSRLIALNENNRHNPWRSALECLAQQLLPPGTAAIHNQAMMELGALVCTPRQPDCRTCPLRGPCRALKSGKPELFPARPIARQIPHHNVAIALIYRGERLFVDQRPYGGLLGGLWEFPGGKIAEGETVEQALQRELAEEFSMTVEIQASLLPVAHAYSHFKVTLHPRLCRFIGMNSRAGEGPPWRWIALEELTQLAMPKANRKVIAQLNTLSKGDRER
jgi:A/G-specific adenine glycosylase